MLLRIGKTYDIACSNLLANGVKIPWTKEAIYLGIYLKSGCKFSCGFESFFYIVCVANSIF